MQHLSRYKLKLTFDPELLFGVPFQYQNRIALEFNHLYHWHPLMPDNFDIGEYWLSILMNFIKDIGEVQCERMVSIDT